MPDPGHPLRRQEAPPPGTLVPPPRGAKPACKSARCGVGDGSPRPHSPRPRKRGSGPRQPAPRTGSLGEGECPTPDTPPPQAQGAPPEAPSCRPHSAQSQLARACAVGLVTGPEAHTPHIHGKLAAGPSLRPQRPMEGSVFLGPFCRAVVRCLLCALPGSAAPGGRCCLATVRLPWLWPAACLCGVLHGSALVRRTSSGPVALGAPSVFSVAVVPSPTTGALAPGFTGQLRGARGGRLRTGLIAPAAGPCRGRGVGRAPCRTCSGPRDGVVPGGSLRLRSWAACAAVVRRVRTRSLTRPVCRTVSLPRADLAGALGGCFVWTPTRPLSGRRSPRPGPAHVCLCMLFLAGSGGPASRAGFGVPHLSLGRFLLLLCSAPSGLGLPLLVFCFVLFSPSFLVFCLAPPSPAPPLSPAFCAFWPRVGLALVLCVFSCTPPPAPPFFLLFFLSSRALRLLVSGSGVLLFPASGALGLGAVRFPSAPPFVFAPPPPRLSVLCLGLSAVAVFCVACRAVVVCCGCPPCVFCVLF